MARLHNGYDQEKVNFDYKRKEIKAEFEKADKKIPNISTSYEKDPDSVIILVECLHLTICQNLLIHLLLFHIIQMKNILFNKKLNSLIF